MPEIPPDAPRHELEERYANVMQTGDPHVDRLPDELRHDARRTGSLLHQAPGLEPGRRARLLSLRALAWVRERPDVVAGVLGGIVVLGVGGWLALGARVREAGAASRLRGWMASARGRMASARGRMASARGRMASPGGRTSAAWRLPWLRGAKARRRSGLERVRALLGRG